MPQRRKHVLHILPAILPSLEKRNEQAKAGVKTTKANSKSKTQTN